MKVRKREIGLERNDEMMERLATAEATPKEMPESVSLRKFIDLNFQAFTDSGKTTREIYEFLKEENIDVGSFQVFKSLYSRVRRACHGQFVNPIRPPVAEAPSDDSKVQASSGKEKKEGSDHKNGQSRYNPALPPVYLPGGVEAIIDPETGAKYFEIKSGKESETT
jgi:hypothetical protein